MMQVGEHAPFVADSDLATTMDPRDTEQPVFVAMPRNTLMEQRAVFEQLRQRFNDINSSGSFAVATQDLAEAHDPRAHELEEALQVATRENLEMSVRLMDVEETLGAKGTEAMQHLKSRSELEANLLDLRLDLEARSAELSRQEAENVELRRQLVELREENKRRSLERASAYCDEIARHAAHEDDVKEARERAAAAESQLAKLREALREATAERLHVEGQLADQRLISTQMRQLANRARAQAEEAQGRHRACAEQADEACHRAEERVRQLALDHRQVAADYALAGAEGQQRCIELKVFEGESKRLRAENMRLTSENEVTCARLKVLSEGFFPGGSLF